MGFEQFLDMQLYLTSEPDKNFLQDLALQLALERVNNQDSSELLAKLKEKTKYGRPDWDQVRPWYRSTSYVSSKVGQTGI